MPLHNSIENYKHTRNPFLDILKAYAIILVVWGHCIQYGAGQAYGDNNLYYENVVFQTIYSFHMPLFILISGFLFGFSIKKGWIECIHKKFHTLLVPSFVWAILFFAIALGEKLVCNEPITLWASVKGYLMYALFSFWFLWAIFGCSLLVALVNRFFKDSIWIYVAIFIASFFVTDSFNIGMYKYMYPYFLAGYFFQKFNGKDSVGVYLKRPSFCIGMGLLFSVALYFFTPECFIYTTGHSLIGKDMPFQLGVDLYRYAIGFLGCAFSVSLIYQLSTCCATSNILNTIGRETMGIYIISSFINVHLLQRITCGSDGPHFFLIGIESIVIVLCCHVIICLIKKSRFLSRYLLGSR